MVEILKQMFHSTRRFLAKMWLKFFPKLIIIGITGSYGKTNTACAITSVLTKKAPTLQTDLNLDTVYNLPITLLKLRPWHQFLVLELGVDHKKEMDSYLKLVRPKIGVLTGISPVHAEIGLLFSIKGIMEEKGKLLESLPKEGFAILNWDDEKVKQMAGLTKAKKLWYSLKNKQADIWAEDIKVDFEGTSFKLNCQDKSYKVKIDLIGKHFVHAVMAATLVGIVCGLTFEEIIEGLKSLKPLWGRMNISRGPLGTTLLDDHLRANPASTKAGLETFASFSYQGRKIAILGEMGELGQYKEEEHRKIGQLIANLKIDFLISIGPLQKLTAQEAIKKGMSRNHVFWVNDVVAAAAILKKIIKEGDFLYLKGSLLRHLERVIYILEGKTINCRENSCHFYHQCQGCSKF